MEETDEKAGVEIGSQRGHFWFAGHRRERMLGWASKQARKQRLRDSYTQIGVVSLSLKVVTGQCEEEEEAEIENGLLRGGERQTRE